MFGNSKSRLTEQDVLQALKGVQDPDLHRDLVDLGMIKNVVVGDGRVSLTWELRKRLREQIPSLLEGADPNRIL